MLQPQHNIKCLHPQCEELAWTNEVACKKHWHKLPSAITYNLSRCAARKKPDEAEQWKKKAIDYYTQRMGGMKS